MVEIISVVIPTKDRATFLVRAIESVLYQDYNQLEIIVVDDGSTDGTYELVQNKYPQIRLIRNDVSAGGAMARNMGAEQAKGKYIAFLDSDDEWLPDHLSSKIEFIKKQGASGVFGSFFLIGAEHDFEVKFAPWREQSIGDMILGNQRFDCRTSTFVFKREPFLKVKFDNEMPKHQDWDLAIRFARLYPLVLDRLTTVKIHVSRENRMSSSLNLVGSKYFLEKNHEFVSGKSILIFCIKLWWRAKRTNDSNAKEYLLLVDNYRKKMSTLRLVVLQILKTGLLHPNLIYNFKKLFTRN
ncbi:MAG: glycosyltransferase family 2 protein [Fulvivirga sp.]